MKEIIRKKLIEERKKITKEENRDKSKKIKEKLFGLKEYDDAKSILFYVSYNGEVFTHEIIKEALKDKKVVVPISNKEERSLILSELSSFDDLKGSSYGILEPKKECIKEVNINEIDLIIVPGVAFDLKGNRIGHGKGYYDRLLKNTNAPIIALAFEFQIIKNIPIEEHDKSVDIIITEKRVVDCSK